MQSTLTVPAGKRFSLQKYIPELAVLALYIALYTVMAVFHEPWFDEAQAWQIAKYSSIKEILFTVGHYEGHPFLWYFILALPSKLGVPFEVGLKAVGWIISVVSAYIIIFKSPFPKVVRCIIPFTYFFFYQYGVIVRPYGLMLLLMLLCAMAFKEKDEHPWKPVFPMILLCTLSAYGIVLAGAMAICWLIDILREYGRTLTLKAAVRDKRFPPLCVLLVSALCILFLILPYADTYSAADEATNSGLLCFVTAVCTFLGDSLITTSPFFNSDTDVLQTANIQPIYVVLGGIVAVVLFAAFMSFSSKKKLKYFVIPYILFAAFSACVYFGTHHIGILTIYFFFWLWITMEDPKHFEVGRSLLIRLKGTEKDIKMVRKLGIIIVFVCMAVNLYWTVGSSVLDVLYQYSIGREASEFLRENGLDQLKVAAEWLEKDISDDEERGPENVNTMMAGTSTLITAYFDHNFIYTFHRGEDIGYTVYKKIDPETNKKNIECCLEEGIPDVVIGPVDLNLITDQSVTLDDYAPVFKLDLNYIFKAQSATLHTYICLRRDLLEKYGLEEIDAADWNFKLTAEMKERYLNGESMEDILEPFFKASGLLPDD